MSEGGATSAAPRHSPSNTTEPKKATDARRVLACGTCRKRKLKCDSKRPKCSTCARLGHPCEYDEVRKKSGPKRGYVKELEARLKQVETLLTSQQNNENSPPQSQPPAQAQSQAHPEPVQQSQTWVPNMTGMNMFNTSSMNVNAMSDIPQDANVANSGLNMADPFAMGGGIDDFNWDMISLGLEEPLPPQDVMDELYQAYFEKVHPSLPMIHRPRFMASLNMPMSQRPPVCLRYILWAHACTILPQYKSSAEQFYQKARRYMEQDEMKGHGESFISIAHAQTWTMIATYEFKNMYFPRAWMSCGRATRICQLMGLHRQDRVGLDVKQTIGPPKDWIEREERRRTFWMAYCQDRYASIGTGWPMAIDEKDILTNLPASEEAFLTGKGEQTPALSDIMAGEGASGLSPFAGVCLLATLFGRNLTHLHRPADDDNDHDLNGEFWKRHRSIDNILLNTSLSLPAHLRLPYGLNDPNIIFANMNIHTSTICLHQAAIFKADKHRLPVQISAESKRRCIVAADQITNIMKMCSHQDLSSLNPFIAFCLYVAARVFVQYLKSKRDDSTVRASLTFLLSAMMALRNKNPLTESFLVQLDVDLEGSGLNIPSPLGPNRYAMRAHGECPVNTDTVKCSPLFEIRETQALGQAARHVEPIAPENLNGINMNMGDTFMTHHKPSDRDGRSPLNRVASVSNTDSPVQSWEQSFGMGFQGKSPSGDGHSCGSSSSNQPTPATSNSSNHNSSGSSFSPHMDNLDNASMFTLNQEPKSNVRYREGLLRAGAAVSQTQQSSSEKVNIDGGGVQINNIPNPGASSHQGTNNGFGNLFGGTGFTPGPSEFTPGPSGSGMTPNWNDMPMTDNADWMYND